MQFSTPKVSAALIEMRLVGRVKNACRPVRFGSAALPLGNQLAVTFIDRLLPGVFVTIRGQPPARFPSTLRARAAKRVPPVIFPSTARRLRSNKNGRSFFAVGRGKPIFTRLRYKYLSTVHFIDFFSPTERNVAEQYRDKHPIEPTEIFGLLQPVSQLSSRRFKRETNERLKNRDTRNSGNFRIKDSSPGSISQWKCFIYNHVQTGVLCKSRQVPPRRLNRRGSPDG